VNLPRYTTPNLSKRHPPISPLSTSLTSKSIKLKALKKPSVERPKPTWKPSFKTLGDGLAPQLLKTSEDKNNIHGFISSSTQNKLIGIIPRKKKTNRKSMDVNEGMSMRQRIEEKKELDKVESFVLPRKQGGLYGNLERVLSEVSLKGKGTFGRIDVGLNFLLNECI
jgi:hypothetical protein